MRQAAYIGIVISVIKLLEIFATPFNLILLPKFAEFKIGFDKEKIKHKINPIVSFIITALPFFSVLIFGLSKYIIILFYGTKYASIYHSIGIIILFSPFYLGYVLIRGILDGLFKFPYVNIICISALTTLLLSSFILDKTVFYLSLSFGLGLMSLGIISVVILYQRIKFDLNKNDIFYSLSFSLTIFVFLFILDNTLIARIDNESILFILKIFIRLIALQAIFILNWKHKEWFKELKSRLSFDKL